MRTGDEVLHLPTGEAWVVRFDDGKHLSWFGWPPGRALTEDCVLLVPATDAEHRDLLKQMERNCP